MKQEVPIQSVDTIEYVSMLRERTDQGHSSAQGVGALLCKNPQFWREIEFIAGWTKLDGGTSARISMDF